MQKTASRHDERQHARMLVEQSRSMSETCKQVRQESRLAVARAKAIQENSARWQARNVKRLNVNLFSRVPMARKSKTQQLIEGTAGQHPALSVAAHRARSQLVRDSLRVYDGQHLSEMLNVLAGALARTAPVYAMDAASGEPRELVPGEVEGAVAKRSASVLELKDQARLLRVVRGV